MPRSFWKGYLKLSLVMCPVTMVPATETGNTVRFHTLNRKTGHRIVSRYLDAETGQPVDDDDTVSGFARGESDFIQIEDEELEAVRLESARTIDIEMFSPRDAIGWTWLDQAHYLIPRERVAEEAFAVIRAAMEATGTVGISRVVLYHRERAVMLEPRDKGIVLWTLRYGDEVRDAVPYFDKIDDWSPNPELLGLMSRLIEDKVRDWSPEMAQDPVQDRLLDIIASKRKRRPSKRRAKDEPTPTGNVISIVDALRRSIEADKPKGRGR